ncbi:hypothetical protein ACQKWADRAFT_284164 [Trichoderma austrokoningii]
MMKQRHCYYTECTEHLCYGWASVFNVLLWRGTTKWHCSHKEPLCLQYLTPRQFQGLGSAQSGGFSPPRLLRPE